MMNRKVRIGFATDLSFDRREAWSGTIAHLYHAMQSEGADVVQAGPILETPTIALNRASKAFRRFAGFDPMLNRMPLMAELKARAMNRRLASQPADVIFAAAGSTLIARIPPGVPIAYTSDVTMRLISSYYPTYSGLPKSVERRAIALEADAMMRSDLLIFPTGWAARSAIEDYGIDPSRIMIQPYGANLEDPPDRASVLGPRVPGPLRLLFCGVDWVRKGGQIALDCYEELRAAGVDATLCILGCVPPLDRLPPGVEVIPFLDKHVPEQKARFRQIFAEADFLILPTQAECYGVVFCEAAAFATVSLATQTGGVPEVIRDQVTGFTIPVTEGGSAYAERILGVIEVPGRLEQMRVAARDDFDNRLNWHVWCAAVLPRMEQLVEAA
ncbi:glycosyltransferase family 4 protein [Rubellimicrobium arenae]|uniref:glycosyltransferase family 4 protein n=1 Tax=Rubellimicrobium arenae TaxID=2817372 RepID=UPI001B302A75|nr:glycosyltransferase family 4 protein [Rubellimicrobium arenae]